MTTPLDDLLVKTRAENRAALIAYIPAGFPSIEGCKKVIQAFVDGGVDAIEIGFPYSDPVMMDQLFKLLPINLFRKVPERAKYLKRSKLQQMPVFQPL